jgi:L-aspartate oxidase
VYADAAAKHALSVIPNITHNENVPLWNDEGTSLNEEMVLITQSKKEVGQIMSNYVGIVRSNLRLKRAFERLELLYKETEDLFDRSIVTKELCELRNVINTAYLVIKMAMERKESRGLHYTIDYPSKIE